MIKVSRGSSNVPLSMVVIVAFDPTKGDVYATYGHAYHGESDETGVERGREKLLKDVLGRLGRNANIELVQIQLSDLEGGWIERVDPTTRTVVIQRECHISAGITRP